MVKIKEEEKGHVFSEKGHVHKLDGKRLTGVTTVLGVLDKPYLIPWAANMAVKYIMDNSSPQCYEDDLLHYEVQPKVLEDAKTAWRTIRDKAGDKGKDTHAIIEEIIKTALLTGGWITNLKTHSDPQINNFLKWALDNEVRFLASEKLVHSKDLWIGGICDFICEIKGKRFIGDIKTSKVISPINYWQTSAYDYCLNEMGEGLAGSYIIVRLGKDELDKDGKVIKKGSFEVGENHSFDNNISGFKSALNIYRMLNLIS